MTTPQDKTANNGLILTGIDGSERSHSAAEYAIWISKNSQSPIKFLHTIEHSHKSEHAHHEGNLTPNIRRELLSELSEEERQESKQLLTEGKAILNDVKSMAEQAGLTNIIAKQRHGTLPEALIDLESEIAMVVIGSKGEDHGENKGLGSQLEEAIRAINKPVFIVKKDFTEPKAMMFAYNGSPTSRKALEQLKLGTFCNKSINIHVVCVQKNIADAEQLIADAQEVLGDSNPNLVTQALVGDPIDELTRYQQEHDIDITSMGAFSHGKVHGFFFGSFTTRMLLESKTNFLLIR